MDRRPGDSHLTRKGVKTDEIYFQARLGNAAADLTPIDALANKRRRHPSIPPPCPPGTTAKQDASVDV